MNLRLLGAPTLKDITKDLVDASSIHQHIVAVPDDRLFYQNCELFLSHLFELVLTCAADESLEGAQLRAKI